MLAPPLTPSPDHVVQLYTTDTALARNVSRYLCEGLSAGDSALVICTASHTDLFREALRSGGIDVAEAERIGTLLFLDAGLTLAKILVGGRPDWDRFQKTITAAADSVRPRSAGRIHAFGEMVGMLWAEGAYSAAIRLEEFWNRILGPLQASLYCAYPIDVFGTDFDSMAIHSIFCDHSRVVPSDDTELMERCILRAMRKVLGERLIDITSRMKLDSPSEWGAVPAAERMILWIRAHAPHVAPEILRLAREYSHRTAS